MLDPNCDPSGAFLQHVGGCRTGWNFFSHSKFPFPYVYLCHFLFFEMYSFCLRSPKRQMLRHYSANALLPGGWDGIKLAKGWSTRIFLLTGPLPPPTSLWSKNCKFVPCLKVLNSPLTQLYDNYCSVQRETAFPCGL